MSRNRPAKTRVERLHTLIYNLSWITPTAISCQIHPEIPLTRTQHYTHDTTHEATRIHDVVVHTKEVIALYLIGARCVVSKLCLCVGSCVRAMCKYILCFFSSFVSSAKNQMKCIDYFSGAHRTLCHPISSKLSYVPDIGMYRTCGLR